MQQFLFSIIAVLFIAAPASALERSAESVPVPGKIPSAAEPTIDVITKTAPRFFDLIATGNDGALRPLREFKGQVVLVVNTASRCGYTPQYEGLQKLQESYKDKGFTVLGFPSNDFKGQEPGTDKEIAAFCKMNYNVDFPLFQKAPVTGERKQPVFKFLTEEASKELQGEVKWNFEKFLVDRTGRLVARFPTATKPDDPKIKETLEALLKTPPPTQKKKP